MCYHHTCKSARARANTIPHVGCVRAIVHTVSESVQPKKMADFLTCVAKNALTLQQPDPRENT